MPLFAADPVDDLLRLIAAGLCVLATSDRRLAVENDAATAAAARRHAGLPAVGADRTVDAAAARAALTRVADAVATAESVAPGEALAGIAAVVATAAAAAAIAASGAASGADGTHPAPVEALAPRPDLLAHATALVAADPADPVGAAPDAVVALVVAHLAANQIAPWRP